MSGVPQILVSALAAAALLAACGQKGPLFLPTSEAAAGRATLPETLTPAPLGRAITPTPAASAPPFGTFVPGPQR